MAAVSHNHAKYQARLNYIQQLLEDLWNLSLKARNLQSLAWAYHHCLVETMVEPT